MIASTPGTPDGVLSPPWAAARGAAACGRCRRARLPRPAAFGRERDQGRLHARHRPHRLLGALAHRLPALHRGGIDGDREEHLAVGDDDVGQRAGRRSTACRRGSAPWRGHARTCFLGRRHRIPSFRDHARDTIGSAAGGGQRPPKPVDGDTARRRDLRISVSAHRRQAAGGNDGEGGIYRSRRHGLSRWPGISRPRAATRSPSTTAPPPRPRSGSTQYRRQARGDAAAGRRRARTSSWPASATTTICAR